MRQHRLQGLVEERFAMNKQKPLGLFVLQFWGSPWLNKACLTAS
jgi:hypothetical protein